jgi:dTDP-4-dehydrorhamnose 3,5-epimerase-like enzyme
MSNLWNGLNDAARGYLETRSYARAPLPERLSTTGVEAREIASPDGPPDGLASVWIPGVVVFPRTVYPQHCRGFFGEFARSTEGPLHRIGLWPRQWAAARMFAGSAKGFHIHPPHIPEGISPEAWFQQLYADTSAGCGERPYDREQWDVMFFLQGIAEMILVDERPGLERRVMRFIIWGDDLPSASNAGVVIPAGVAHAIRSASSSDLLMVYGTSTTFVPASEGRIASSVEAAPLPGPWLEYLNRP